jgi:predicted secreted protein
MDPVFALSTYFVVWWTTLFAILPLGVQSHHQAGVDVPGGGDPGSPVDPKLKRKFITTTWVSAIVWVVLAVAIRVFGPMLAPRA